MRKPRTKLRVQRERIDYSNGEFCPTTGKVCFETRADALKAANDMMRRHKGNDLSVYRCDDCGFYHVTRCGYEVSKSIRQGKVSSNAGVLYAS